MEDGMNILLADDELNIRNILTEELQHLGHLVTPCADGMESLAALQDRDFDVLLLDLDMPGIGGLSVIEEARKLNTSADIVILTGKGTLEAAQRAIHYAVSEFLTKPYMLTDLERILSSIETKRNTKSGNSSAAKISGGKHGVETDVPVKIIGNSEAMQNVHRLIERIAPTDSTVVILGETGTGKELVARSIHQLSKRKDKPFVAVNCGALPENLIESELFGHRKGSFTGADTNRTGLLEVADGGTLFLDEIGELPKGVQAKLLRFLENGEVRKIGDNTPVICSVRVVCATLRHLEAMVKDGTFREDLWFRINTFEIHIPSLKERKDDDLPDLILYLAKRCRSKLTAKNAADLFSPETYCALLQYDYPGNVRQLANTIEHALVLSDRLPVTLDALPPQIKNEYLSAEAAKKQTFGNLPVKRPDVKTKERPDIIVTEAVVTKKNTGEKEEAHGGETVNELPVSLPLPSIVSLRDLEMQAIETALQRQGGSKAKAAEELGISLKTLYNKLNQTERKSA
ncbi:MAG: sigma-54 dependent transcriptional regulator [Planctomycetaceae bacterium]|jgi:two-component system NtrC family response regulator|nr:sigma-54 dependent transcriptional regulator [Planctomycetaceae bacterium]